MLVYISGLEKGASTHTLYCSLREHLNLAKYPSRSEIYVLVLDTILSEIYFSIKRTTTHSYFKANVYLFPANYHRTLY